MLINSSNPPWEKVWITVCLCSLCLRARLSGSTSMRTTRKWICAREKPWGCYRSSATCSSSLMISWFLKCLLFSRSLSNQRYRQWLTSKKLSRNNRTHLVRRWWLFGLRLLRNWDLTLDLMRSSMRHSEELSHSPVKIINSRICSLPASYLQPTLRRIP